MIRIVDASLFVLLACLLSAGCMQANRVIRTKREAETVHHAHHAKHWGYRNEDKNILPRSWHKNHPKCYGQQQSPINVEFYSTEFDANLTRINILSASKDESSNSTHEIWEMNNNGHTVMLKPVNKEFSFLMQPENELFGLLQIHFHWRGSEHYVNGKKFAAELHLVHQSKNDSNRFAVLGFLFKLVDNDNPFMEPIVDELDDIIKYDKSEKITTFSLEKLTSSKIDNYFRYSGSLTTPDCDEIVEWFVVDSPVLGISEDQLLNFQSVEDKNGYPILTNVRPIQSINERLVRRSFYNSRVHLSKDSLRSASGYSDASSNLRQSAISSNYLILFSIILFKIVSL